jgi:hypothetical protein
VKRWIVYATLVLSLAAGPAFGGGLVFPEGTSWSGPALIKAKVPGDSVTGFVELDVHFGPNGGLGLGVGEFLIVADDGEETFEVTGDFVLDAKGRPVLSPDTTDLATELLDLIVHVCEDVLMLGPQCDFIATLDVVVDPARLKTKVKTKSGSDGPVLALGAKLPFLLTDGEDDAKVTVSLKTDPALQLLK